MKIIYDEVKKGVFYIVRNLKDYHEYVNTMMDEKTCANMFSWYENIDESVILNKNDYYFDFDKFESGESNILFVTGLSGSGKSTTGQSIASKYNAEYVELDLLDPLSGFCKTALEDMKDKDLHLIKEYLSKHRDTYEKIRDSKLTDSESIMNIWKFVGFVKSYANQHKESKFVVEGIQLYEYCAERNCILRPMIIKGTSVLTSFFRKVKREKWSKLEVLKNTPKTIRSMVKNDQILKDIINSYYIEK